MNRRERELQNRQGWEWPALEFVLIGLAASLLGGMVYWYLS